jgi:hypothetical protein
MEVAMDVVINNDQELFVVSAGRGYSTLGFEFVFKQLKQLVARLNLSIQIREDEKGTIGQYADYQKAVAEAAKANIKETWFSLETPTVVRRLLEHYRRSGKLIRIFYGDVRTGEDWLEENDVVGKVGRSSGTFKIPILLQEGESWGVSILDKSIVRLMDVATRKILWEHSTYQSPKLEILATRCGTNNYVVNLDGGPHASFSSYAKAAQWVAFMAGECMELPQ